LAVFFGDFCCFHGKHAEKEDIIENYQSAFVHSVFNSLPHQGVYSLNRVDKHHIVSIRCAVKVIEGGFIDKFDILKLDTQSFRHSHTVRVMVYPRNHCRRTPLFYICCRCADSAPYLKDGCGFKHSSKYAEKLPCFRFNRRNIMFFGIVVHIFIFCHDSGADVFKDTGY